MSFLMIVHGGFVHKIITFPDLVVVCGMHNVIKDFDQLLQWTATKPQLLSYDTSFNFYVATLLLRNVYLKKKTTKHSWRIAADEVPALVKGKIKVTTCDRWRIGNMQRHWSTFVVSSTSPVLEPHYLSSKVLAMKS